MYFILADWPEAAPGHEYSAFNSSNKPRPHEGANWRPKPRTNLIALLQRD